MEVRSYPIIQKVAESTLLIFWLVCCIMLCYVQGKLPSIQKLRLQVDGLVVEGDLLAALQYCQDTQGNGTRYST